VLRDGVVDARTTGSSTPRSGVDSIDAPPRDYLHRVAESSSNERRYEIHHEPGNDRLFSTSSSNRPT